MLRKQKHSGENNRDLFPEILDETFEKRLYWALQDMVKSAVEDALSKQDMPMPTAAPAGGRKTYAGQQITNKRHISQSEGARLNKLGIRVYQGPRGGTFYDGDTIGREAGAKLKDMNPQQREKYIASLPKDVKEAIGQHQQFTDPATGKTYGGAARATRSGAARRRRSGGSVGLERPKDSEFYTPSGKPRFNQFDPKNTKLFGERTNRAGNKEYFVKATGQTIPSDKWGNVWVAKRSDQKMQIWGRRLDTGKAEFRYKAQKSAKTGKTSEDHVNAVKMSRIKQIHKSAKKVENGLKKEALDGNEAAAISYAIMKTGLRVGTDQDTRGSERTTGMHSLRASDVEVEGNTVFFNFTGKGGRDYEHSVDDPTLAKLFKKALSGKSDDDFVWSGDHNKTRAYYTEFMNRTVGERKGKQWELKDGRTYYATDLAVQEIHKMNASPNTVKEVSALKKKVAEVVSSHLNNSPHQALKSYIDPSVFAVWDAAVSGEAVKSKAYQKKSMDSLGSWLSLQEERNDFAANLDELFSQVQWDLSDDELEDMEEEILDNIGYDDDDSISEEEQERLNDEWSREEPSVAYGMFSDDQDDDDDDDEGIFDKDEDDEIFDEDDEDFTTIDDDWIEGEGEEWLENAALEILEALDKARESDDDPRNGHWEHGYFK